MNVRYVTNAFALSMLPDGGQITFTPVDVRTARVLARGLGEPLNIRSAIGHADSAALFSRVLGLEIPMNRITLRLDLGDELLVGQYVGPRLPEGVLVLPEGAEIRWMAVVVTATGPQG